MTLLAVAGCTEASAPSGSKSGRVAAVEADKPEVADPAVQAKAWCDVLHAPDTAEPFTYPALADGASGRTGTARWINVWATWCGPCVEELPRIEDFSGRLAGDGARVQVELVAADEPDALREFQAKHAAAKSSLRFADPEGLVAWIGAVGLDDSAGLPIHLFIDAKDRLRCAKLGGVSDDDYDNVLAVLRTL